MSTFEFLTLGAILKQDEKLVTRYLKERKSAPSREKLQQDIFGCSLHQVSTLLLCNMGYGADIANAYCLALDPKRTLDSNENGFLARMQVSRMWIEALMAGKSQPDQKLSARFFPMESVRGELDRNIGQIREGLPHWIARSKDDISATATPQLFVKPEKGDSEIPPELQAVFSVDEISNMDVDAFDQLIDQLDYEKDGGKPPAGMVVMSAKDLKEIDGIVE